MIDEITKEKTFQKQYTYIKNNKYREALKKMVSMLPDYFFEVAASSTGKYHPNFALGEGGLVRHTKVAVEIAHELFQDTSITGKFNQNEKDLMIFALVLHDGLKHGTDKNEYVQAEHPLLISKFIVEHQEEFALTQHEIDFICNVIDSHMGPWNTDYRGNEILPVPVNKYQKFVHMCDYLASRKFLDVKFDDMNNICN